MPLLPGRAREREVLSWRHPRASGSTDLFLETESAGRPAQEPTDECRAMSSYFTVPKHCKLLLCTSPIFRGTRVRVGAQEAKQGPRLSSPPEINDHSR